MASNNLDLIKTLLVACDQSYFTNPTGLKGKALSTLPDRNPSVVEYHNNRGQTTIISRVTIKSSKI